MHKDVKYITCIGCPKGCALTAEQEEAQVRVWGYGCKKGKEYGISEAVNPVRTVTTTVKIAGKGQRMLPVKTEFEIPKGKIFACMAILKQIQVELPVNIGDVICENVADTGVKVVAVKRLSIMGK